MRAIQHLLKLRAIHPSVAQGIDYLRFLRRLTRGAKEFARTGTTPQTSYYALLDLHCATRGYSNDFLHWLVRRAHRPYALPEARGVLGDLSAGGLTQVLRSLQRDGFHVFASRLPERLIHELTVFARTQPARPVPEKPELPRRTVYDPANPIAPKYDFEEPDLLRLPPVQQLVSDPSILQVAQGYLRCAPIFDMATMWWSTAFQKTASAEAAQLFHFDMDRIKWLKFFFYLTDVGKNNGPTRYVKGSHRRGRQPRELLRHGYTRLTDEQMAKFYPPDAFVDFTGPAGTIVAADTRAFHKGTPLVAGDRLVLQLEYCDSLFGGAYETSALSATEHARLYELARQYPRVLSKFSWEPER